MQILKGDRSALLKPASVAVLNDKWKTAHFKAAESAKGEQCEQLAPNKLRG